MVSKTESSTSLDVVIEIQIPPEIIAQIDDLLRDAYLEFVGAREQLYKDAAAGIVTYLEENNIISGNEVLFFIS